MNKQHPAVKLTQEAINKTAEVIMKAHWDSLGTKTLIVGSPEYISWIREQENKITHKYNMSILKDKFPLAFESINFPVKYIPGLNQIVDNKSYLILEVRGWGRLQKLSDPHERQDQIGQLIAELLNNTQ